MGGWVRGTMSFNEQQKLVFKFDLALYKLLNEYASDCGLVWPSMSDQYLVCKGQIRFKMFGEKGHEV